MRNSPWGEIRHVHQPEDQRETDRDQAVEQPHQEPLARLWMMVAAVKDVVLSTR